MFFEFWNASTISPVNRLGQGIICGHIYYYLEDVFPNVEGGFHILVTPYLLKRLFDPVREELTTENDQGEGPGGFDWGDENEQNRQN